MAISPHTRKYNAIKGPYTLQPLLETEKDSFLLQFRKADSPRKNNPNGIVLSDKFTMSTQVLSPYIPVGG
jgi:hypothetical protein